MLRMLWTAFLFLVLFLSSAIAESVPSLHYEISSSGTNQLDVMLTVQRGGGYYYHSAGGMEILSLTNAAGLRLPYSTNNSLLYVNAADFRLHYRVNLGALEKHGHQGFAENGEWMASGAQALLLPLGAYSIIEEEIAQAVGEITLSGSISSPRQLISPGWADIHSLLKSCMTNGIYHTEKIGSITLLSQAPPSPQTIRRLELIQQRLFDAAGAFPEITVIFADAEKEIMGGAGGYAIGASFDPENNRDWELLTHRLFHACFDLLCPHYAAHMPGNLWLYEGLAVYHEEAWQDDFENATLAMLSRLHARWAYCRNAADEFRIIPSGEADLSHAATEFLHYTQAPLMVYELLKNETVPHLVQAFRQAVFSLSPNQAESDAAQQVCLAITNSDDIMDTSSSLTPDGLPPLSKEQVQAAIAEYLPLINSWLITDGKSPLQ